MLFIDRYIHLMIIMDKMFRRMEILQVTFSRKRCGRKVKLGLSSLNQLRAGKRRLERLSLIGHGRLRLSLIFLKLMRISFELDGMMYSRISIQILASSVSIWMLRILSSSLSFDPPWLNVLGFMVLYLGEQMRVLWFG